MAELDRRERLQVPLDQDVIRKIEELAAALGRSKASVASQLLADAVADHAWLIQNIAAPAKRLIERLGDSVKSGRKQEVFRGK